jgi:hypothetical protein
LLEFSLSKAPASNNYPDIVFIKIIKVKVKIKFTLEQTTKAHRGSRGIALLFL